MNVQTAFKVFWGMKLHFSSFDYSILKYGVDTKSANSKYIGLSKDQKFKFDWLSTKYPENKDLVYACIGTQFDSINIQYDKKDEIIESYIKFKKRRESLSYIISSDIETHSAELKGELSSIIISYFIGKYSPEYILLLTADNDQLFELYNDKNFVWAKDKILKLIKYRPFFNSNKFLPLLNLNENHE